MRIIVFKSPLKRLVWRLVLMTSSVTSAAADARAGGYLGIFWVGLCRPGLEIGTPF